MKLETVTCWTEAQLKHTKHNTVDHKVDFFFKSAKKRYDLINKRMNVMLKVFPYLFLCDMFYFLPCSDLYYI